MADTGRIEKDGIIDSLTSLGINGGAKNSNVIPQRQRSGSRVHKVNSKSKKYNLTTRGGIQLKEKT